MRKGYRVASSAFIVGVVALLLGALFHRISGVAVLVGGTLFAISGVMVFLNIGGAGVDAVEGRRRWMRRWLPWIASSEANDPAMMTFTGLLAIVAGIVFAALGIALIGGNP